MRSVVARRVILATIGTAPFLLMYALHALWAPSGLSPTGFLQHDQAYYMANAREAFDGGTFPFYSLPFSADYTAPAVYFHPFLLALGTLVRFTPIDPGLAYAITGLAASVVAFYLALVLCDLYVDAAATRWDKAAWLTRLTFMWGGGVLVVAAIVAERIAPSGMPLDKALLRFDPFDGYWFLSLGRNMFYSTEALYHAVFFLAVILLLRRRYGAAFAVMILEGLSHPFSGLQLLAIVAAFCVTETIGRRREHPPLWFTAGAACLLAAHVGYYLVFLNAVSADHRALQQQWALPWILPLSSMAFAYFPVATVAGSRFAGMPRVRRSLADRRVRFALVWCLVSVILAKHELFLKPHQPLHFTRGYIWIPLALLSAPVFEGALRRLFTVRPRVVGAVAATGLCLLAIVDNATWLTLIGQQIKTGRSLTLYLPAEARRLYARLSEPDMRNRLLLTNEPETGYLALVYTPLRTWYSHPFNTPNAEQHLADVRWFFTGGGGPPEWSGHRFVLVVSSLAPPDDVESSLRLRGFRTIDRFGRYAVMIKDGPPAR